MYGLQLSACFVGAPVSLEGYGSTIELYPQNKGLARLCAARFTGGLRAAQPPRPTPSVAAYSRLDPMQDDPAAATGAGVRSNACVRALPPQATAALVCGLRRK